MRKKPWFYLFLFGLSVAMALFTRLTMAMRQEDFYLFPDAPFWLFLEVLLGVALLDWLNARWLRQGQTVNGVGYYFRLMWVGGLLFLGLTMSFDVLITALNPQRSLPWEWYYWVRELGINLFLYLIFSSLYLPFLYQQHLAAAQTKLEQLEKEAVRARLQALQQHVNPHFLFNNLNILASLIEPANTQAHHYAARLAHLYRYLVRTRYQDVVPAAEELAFARDYCYLLKQRFGTAYQFEEEVHVPAAQLQTLLLPPGVLQELLTNAIKHNLASRAQPLRVQLTLTPECVTLRNPRQPRPAPAEGEGSGLPGLRARFALLTDAPVVVREQPDEFSVSLPVLSPVPLPAAHHADLVD